MGDKPLILVVEDEKDMRENLSEILKEKYEVVCAANGKEALDILEDDNKIQVALLDIKLPDISGIEILKTIKKSIIEREVIMVTALHDLQIAVESMRDGAYDYITKPFLVIDLLNTIGRALETYNLASQIKWADKQNFKDEIDRNRRVTLFQELRMKRRIEGTAVSPEELITFFPHNEEKVEISLESLKRSLEKDAGEKVEEPKKASILVVEDEIDMRENIKDCLSGNYNVLLAGNGKSALDLINSNKDIDIVLLDIRLPDISGLDLIKKVKEIIPGVDIIMVTALNDIESAVGALKNGAYDYITKPFFQADLLCALARTLEKRYYQKALPALYEKFKEKKLSYERRLQLLNELCEKRKAEDKGILIDDIYVFFPEYKNTDIPASFSIPAKTLDTGLREFIVNLGVRSKRLK